MIPLLVKEYHNNFKHSVKKSVAAPVRIFLIILPNLEYCLQLAKPNLQVA